MATVTSKFGDIPSDVLANKVKEVLIKASLDSTIGASRSGCGWRYYLCAAAITATAILCHAGCQTTALAATAGAGIPACIVACGTVQAWGLAECAEHNCGNVSYGNPSSTPYPNIPNEFYAVDKVVFNAHRDAFIKYTPTDEMFESMFELRSSLYPGTDKIEMAKNLYDDAYSNNDKQQNLATPRSQIVNNYFESLH